MFSLEVNLEFASALGAVKILHCIFRRETAKKENDFIFHDRVPSAEKLPNVEVLLFSSDPLFCYDFCNATSYDFLFLVMIQVGSLEIPSQTCIALFFLGLRSFRLQFFANRLVEYFRSRNFFVFY